MNMYYLFDFDGTLVDSMPTFGATMLRILKENRISYEPDIIKTITPMGISGTATYFIEVMGVPMAHEQLMAQMTEYMQEDYFHNVPAKANVIDTLQELKRRGASLNILTANMHITLDACLKRLGMWELFDNIWSSDDFGTSKADPDIYRQAAQRMGTSVDAVLFLDDNLNADLTAKAAGMRVCGVYDESSADYVEQMKAAADFYIYDFKELLAIEP